MLLIDAQEVQKVLLKCLYTKEELVGIDGMLKDAMRERGWFWHGWEDESGANVQYWKPGEFRIEYGKDLMQANVLAAAEATGYESE